MSDWTWVGRRRSGRLSSEIVATLGKPPSTHTPRLHLSQAAGDALGLPGGILFGLDKSSLARFAVRVDDAPNALHPHRTNGKAKSKGWVASAACLSHLPCGRYRGHPAGDGVLVFELDGDGADEQRSRRA